MINIDLSGRVALVTGGSGELGRVMARTLARAGATVAVHYRKGEERAQAVVDEIRSAGGTAAAFSADITQKEQVLDLRDRIACALGPVNIVINNAVIQYAWKPLLDQPEEDFVSQFESCVMQTVLTTKAFAPAMINQKWGRIISINTECAIQCLPTQSAYASAKRGLDGIVRVLARELGSHQITVNQVAPGWTISDSHRLAKTESQPDYEASIPLRRRGTDHEVANAVLFLASDLASYITGAYIPVSGGNVIPGL